MKHNLKITIALLLMFIITQFVGLYVVDYYSPVKVIGGNLISVPSPELPFGLGIPKVERESDYYSFFTGIVIAFAIAIFLFLFLKKFKIEILLRIWFFTVIFISLSISLLSITSKFINYALVISIITAFLLSLIKIFKRNLFVHNITEILIYPGISAVFVPILNIYTIVFLLVIISIYDVWAVWHSGIMQKMAKYQINQLKIFSGFFVPYISKKMRMKIKKWKVTLSKSQLKKKKIKIDIAILGGGDIVFPIITAGVMLKTFGLLSAIIVIIGATLGLGYLFFFAEKKKFYPAMPFITTGILIGIGVSYLVI
ncbi:MAG: presenilin family intramembrane aspartyl protease [Candidatus Pacearchaeota archaeon]